MPDDAESRKLLVLSRDALPELNALVTSLAGLRIEGVRELAVDFSEVSLLSSALLGQLVRLHFGTQREGMVLKLLGLSVDMRRTLGISGIGGLLGIKPA